MDALYELPNMQIVKQAYPIECFIQEEKVRFNPAHWHHWIELIYVEKGKYKITVNGIPYHLKAGDLIYILPDQIHTATVPAAQTLHAFVLKFDAELLISRAGFLYDREILNPFLTKTVCPCLYFPSNELDAAQIVNCFHIILSEFQHKSSGYLVAIRNQICSLVFQLFRTFDHRYDKSSFEHVSEDCPNPFYPVFVYIDEHYTQDINIEQLLQLCHLSYSNFAMKFKKIAGKSFVDYVNCCRIQRAQQLLTHSDLMISEISAECGFHDVCYFNRQFKKHTGVSPSVYKASCRTE